MTPLICEMVKVCPDAELFHWFDASQIAPDQRINMSVVAETPLPYSRCAIVGVDGASKWLTLLGQEGDVVAYAGWTCDDTGYEKHPSFTYTRTDKGLELHTLKGDAPPDAEVARGLIATVGAWLQALQPGQSAYKPEPRKSLINAKRKAKGLGPVLFDWHTVTVQPAKPKGDSKGGTHASPRLHDRRGHWRKYPSGKVGWVKNCKVGDASRGVVFKDYEVKT
jgi:hypothetical protein